MTAMLYFVAVDDSYYYTLDSLLMFMSKGAITLDVLMRLGVRSKNKYMEPLSDIFRTFYGGGKGAKDEINLES